MRLIYAYAKNYRNFKNQAFALTNSYQVQLLGEHDNWSGIRITRVDTFKQNLPPNILSISALVGRNATGKTNFVEMIGAEYRQSGYGGEGQTDAYFLLYASNQEESDHYYFEVVSPQQFGTLFSWMEADQDSSCAAGWCRYDSTGERLLMIDPKTAPGGKSVMISLCDHLQNYDMVGKYEFPVERTVGKYAANTFASQVRVVREIYRNKDRTVLRDPKYRLKLICDMKYLTHGPDGTPLENIPLFPTLYDKAALPAEDRCVIRIAEGWIKFLAGSQIDDFDTWLSLQQSITSWPNDQTPPDQNDSFPQISRLLEHYHGIVIDFLKDQSLLSNFQELDQLQIEEFFKQLLGDLMLERTESSVIIPVVPIDEAGKTDVEIQKTVQNLIDNFTARHERLGKFFYSVWENISDGELWYIHFLASISEALENITSVECPDTCILVLDEPEIHMHPDLARQLLDHLTQWLQDYYGRVNIQIILTTHSPFILSDIEKGNVQVLRRSGGDAESEYWTQVGPPKNQTYAANIYTLLTDSFFLDSGFGEMARKQIKWLLNSLDPESHSDLGQDYFAAAIHNVGERLVREQLDEKFRTKFGAYSNNDPREVDR